MKRMYPQAFAEYDVIAKEDKVVARESQQVAATLGWLYAISGRRADALRIVKQFRDLSSHSYVDFYLLGEIYAGLAEKDEAFGWLERAYEESSGSMARPATDPWWHEIRSDPRYTDLLRRMGRPEPK